MDAQPKPVEIKAEPVKPAPNNKCDDCGAKGPTVAGLCAWCRRAFGDT